MKATFLCTAAVLIGIGLLDLTISLQVLATPTPATSIMLTIGSVVFGALLIGLGIYLFVLTLRFGKPGNDIRPLLRKGGYVLLGSGFALATTFVWLAMPYFMGTSCNMALLPLYLGTPVVIPLLIFGAMALYEARMR